MEFKLDTKQIGTEHICLDTVSEQPVDLDFTLPDYCPDIEKILKCTLSTQIYNRNLTGGQLIIDGMSVVQVLYVDSIKGNIRSCEQTVPFSSAFNLSEPTENYIILSDTKTEYINCRALSPRKLVLHGAFTLYAKVISKSYENLYIKSNESDLEIKTDKITCCDLNALCQEMFSVSEDISVENKPSIEAILSKKVTTEITDVRIISGKIMINGDINLKLLYLSDLETGEPQQLDYMLPFNRIIDCDTVNEHTDANINVQVLSYDIRLKSEMLSESVVIALDVKLMASITGYTTVEENVIIDAYSTKYVTDLEYSKPILKINTANIKETLMKKSSLNLGDTKISKIIDLYNDNSTVITVITEDGITATGKVNVCILAMDEENHPVYIERIVDFEHLFKLSDGYNSVVNPKVVVKSMSYRLTDNSNIELRYEINVNLQLQNLKQCKFVSNVISPEEKEIKPSCFALTLYYAQKDESLWDIAKRYNTKQELLIQENSLETDILDNSQMLLIPSV